MNTETRYEYPELTQPANGSPLRGASGSVLPCCCYCKHWHPKMSGLKPYRMGCCHLNAEKDRWNIWRGTKDMDAIGSCNQWKEKQCTPKKNTNNE